MSNFSEKTLGVADKIATPAYTLPSSGGGLIIGSLTGSDILMLLSALLVLLQIIAISPKIEPATCYWLRFWGDKIRKWRKK